MEIVLCHVLFHYNKHAVTKFQGCTDFLWFLIIACTNPQLWYGCQGELSARSKWVNFDYNNNGDYPNCLYA